MAPDRPVSLSKQSSSVSVMTSIAGLLGRFFVYAACIILSVSVILSLAAEASEPEDQDLMSMNIEDLMTMEVTSVSKQSEKMMDASAAIFVITGEDIRRSGAHNIPELLRMVPGMQVGRLDNNDYAVSARGFNDIFGNKLLVLIDGRSVYTPSFSGVFWSTQDLVLGDIDRIEVIRGPGATLWGANAVNGVINVITKDTAETKGTLVETSADNRTQRILSLRHGAELAPNLRFRGHLKFRTQDASTTVPGATDESEHVRAGFRLDWIRDTENSLTLQADLYSGEVGNAHTAAVLTPPYTATFSHTDSQDGGHILAHWTHQDEGGSNTSLQVYYDVDDRTSWGQGIENRTFDVEFQHDFAAMENIRMTWGLGYRSIEDSYIDSVSTSVDPLLRSVELLSGFAQGEVSLFQDQMKVTVGSKFEENDFTGFETQPNIRVSYLAGDMTLWAAVARAVRTPSRMENDFAVSVGTIPPFTPMNPDPFPILTQVQGNENLDAEELTAFEIGFRRALSSRLWIDVTAYYDKYDGIIAAAPGTPTFYPLAPVPYLEFPLVLDNRGKIDVSGFELAGTWRASERANVKFAYSLSDVNDKIGNDSNSRYAGPEHQVSVRAAFDLTKSLELDIWGRWVDEIVASGVDAYSDLDVRLGWRVSDGVELSITGKNLTDEDWWEVAPHSSGFLNTPAVRSVFVALRLSFGS